MGIFASFRLGRGKHENGYYTFIVSIKICTLGNLCSYFPTILLYLICFLIHIIERERQRGAHKLSSVYGSNLPERGTHVLGIIIVPEWGHSRAGFQGLKVGMVKPTGAGIQTDTM